MFERRERFARERRDPTAFVRVVERWAHFVDFAVNVSHGVDARYEDHDERQAPIVVLGDLGRDRTIPRARRGQREDDGSAPTVRHAGELRRALCWSALDLAHAEARGDVTPHRVGTGYAAARRDDERARRASTTNEMGAKRLDGAIVNDVHDDDSTIAARHALIECGEVERRRRLRFRNVPEKRYFQRQCQDDKKLPFN